MDEVYYIFADNASPRAQVAFSSFVQAMCNYEVADKSNPGEMISRPMIAIVRRVSRDDTPPKMGVAVARSIDQLDYLVWVRVGLCRFGQRHVGLSFISYTLDAVCGRSASLCISVVGCHQR